MNPATNPKSLHHPKTTNSRSLPSQQFQALLTLFSKFFSSFPHGTCSLSVSRQYLAFDGIYHRHIRAAFPNNPTRTRSSVHLTEYNLSNGALTLSRGLFQGTWTTFLLSKRPTCVDYNSEKIQFFQIYKVGSIYSPGSLAVTRGILVSFSSSAY